MHPVQPAVGGVRWISLHLRCLSAGQRHPRQRQALPTVQIQPQGQPREPNYLLRYFVFTRVVPVKINHLIVRTGEAGLPSFTVPTDSGYVAPVGPMLAGLDHSLCVLTLCAGPPDRDPGRPAARVPGGAGRCRLVGVAVRRTHLSLLPDQGAYPR